MADYEVDLSQLPPIGGTPQQDNPDTGSDAAPQYKVDLSALPPLDTPKPAEQSDWWGDYWGPLKDHAARAYHDSVAGAAPTPPTTDPVTMSSLIQGRAPYMDDIAAGSAPDADATAKARAADSADRLAKIDHVLGIMGNGGAAPEYPGPSSPADALSQTPHARLMASDRYRQVYNSAVPVLGEQAAQDYARSTIAKQAHDIPYLRDSVLADVMGLPKSTAFRENYAPPAVTPDVMSEGAAQAVGGDYEPLARVGKIAEENINIGTHKIAEMVPLAAGGVAKLSDGLINLFGGNTTAAEDFVFKHGVDPFEHNIDVLQSRKPEATGVLEKTVDKTTAMIPALALAVAAKNPQALGMDGAALFGNSAAAQAWNATAAQVVRNLPAAESMAAPGAVDAARATAAQGGSSTEAALSAAGSLASGTAQNVLPIAVGGTAASKALTGGALQTVLGAHGRAAAGQSGDASDLISDFLVGASMGQMHEEAVPKSDKAAQTLAARTVDTLHAVGDDAAGHARIAYALDQVQSGTRNPMWAVAELNSIAKRGTTRDEAAFQQWHDQQAAADVAQTPDAETATPEAAATTEAARELVGEPTAPSAAERDDRFRELAANRQRTPEEHEELANLAQQHVEQARVANSNEPIEGMQNENARQRMLADGELGPHVMKLDLDDFKNVNDTHSYSTGNDAIKNAGERLAQNAPEGVRVFHQSGDEFIAHADDPAKLAQLRDTTNAQLAKDKLLAQNKAGDVTGEIDHPVFSGGIGHDESSAEVALKSEKQRKLESGERVGRRETDAAPAVDAIGRTDGAENAPFGSAEARPAVAPLDAAAHEAATSPLNDKPEPTPAQTSAGNYAKGHVRLQGLDISIENPKGSTRSGVDENGQPWTREMRHHYGYIKGTLGADGQHMDVMLGENPGNPMRPVFVINQRNAAGGFDEHKVMLGFKNQRDAERAYRSEYPRGWDHMGEVRQMASPDFKQWLRTGAREEAHTGPVDAAVPRVTLRNRQTDAVAMHGVTDAPNVGRVDAAGAPLPETPNTNRNIRKRTYFDDARTGATGAHEAVLTNLYDLDKDPRGLVDAARVQLHSRGLPETVDHMAAEVERQVVQHGFDGYRTQGRAAVLGDGVTTRPTTRETRNANDGASGTESGNGREPHASEDAGGNVPAGTARENQSRAGETHGDHIAAKNVDGGARVGGSDGTERAPAHPEPVKRTASNADTEAMRAEAGEPAAESRESKPDSKLESDAKAIIAENRDAGDQLAQSLLKNPRAASDTETAVLVMDRARLSAERAASLDRAAKAIDAGDEVTAAVHAAAAETTLDKLRTNWEATTKAGTEWGRGGRARQLAPDDQYSLARMLTERKVAKGAKLTSAEEAETRAMHEDIAAKEKAAMDNQERTGRRPVSKSAREQAKTDFAKAVEKFKSISKIEQMTKECAL